MRHLITSGYSWGDLYTQCVLTNLMLAIRTSLPYDAQFCDAAAPPTTRTHASRGYDVERQLSSDALRLLTRYLNDKQDQPLLYGK